MTNPAIGMAKGVGLGALAATSTALILFQAATGGTVSDEMLVAVPLIFAWMLVCTLFLMALAAIVLGIPIVWLLGKRNGANAGMVALAGALVGAALFLVPTIATGDTDDPLNWALIMASCIGGAITGWVWGAAQAQLHRERWPTGHPNRLHDDRILR